MHRVLFATALGMTGCFGGGGSAQPARVSDMSATEVLKSDTRMTQVDLDQFCLGFGERYLTLVGNACNQVERAVQDREVKGRAHSFKLHAASSVYDIATGSNPFAKRMPLLARWHAESLLNTVMSRPEMDGLRQTADRIAAVAESMPAKIAEERVELLKAAKERVSHAGDEARGVADRIALLAAGLIVLVFALAMAYRKLGRRGVAPPASPVPAPDQKEAVSLRD